MDVEEKGLLDVEEEVKMELEGVLLELVALSLSLSLLLLVARRMMESGNVEQEEWAEVSSAVGWGVLPKRTMAARRAELGSACRL